MFSVVHVLCCDGNFIADLWPAHLLFLSVGSPLWSYYVAHELTNFLLIHVKLSGLQLLAWDQIHACWAKLSTAWHQTVIHNSDVTYCNQKLNMVIKKKCTVAQDKFKKQWCDVEFMEQLKAFPCFCSSKELKWREEKVLSATKSKCVGYK